MLLMQSDGSYEYAYAWEYGACEPPDVGAFAERYEGTAEVDCVVLDLSSLPGSLVGDILDAYVWDDGNNRPGQVMCIVTGVDLGPAQWPQVSRHFIELPESVCVEDTWWVGWWGQWPGGQAECFVGADLDGPGGGLPMTKIAPGLGYPSGWQDVAVRWGPTAALGIGAVVDSCPPTPVDSDTWGSIKALYR